MGSPMTALYPMDGIALRSQKTEITHIGRGSFWARNAAVQCLGGPNPQRAPMTGKTHAERADFVMPQALDK
jgi:hypothetical protein